MFGHGRLHVCQNIHIWSCSQNRPIMTMWYFEAHNQARQPMDSGSKHRCIHEKTKNDAMFEKDYQEIC